MIPLPNGDAFLSLSEAAEVVGLAKSTVASMRSRGHFLEPDGDLGGQSPAWLKSRVEAWRTDRNGVYPPGLPNGAYLSPVAGTESPAEPGEHLAGAPVGPISEAEEPELGIDGVTPEQAAVALELLTQVKERLSGVTRRQVVPLLRLQPSQVDSVELCAAVRNAAAQLPPDKSAALTRWILDNG